MKLPKLIKLGHRNLVHHKKQTILTVVVIGVLFSILIAVQFIFQGLEDFHRQQSLGVFDNKIYITAQGNYIDCIDYCHYCIDSTLSDKNRKGIYEYLHDETPLWH